MDKRRVDEKVRRHILQTKGIYPYPIEETRWTRTQPTLAGAPQSNKIGLCVLPCGNVKKGIEKDRTVEFSNIGWLSFRENDPIGYIAHR